MERGGAGAGGGVGRDYSLQARGTVAQEGPLGIWEASGATSLFHANLWGLVLLLLFFLPKTPRILDYSTRVCQK